MRAFGNERKRNITAAECLKILHGNVRILIGDDLVVSTVNQPQGDLCLPAADAVVFDGLLERWLPFGSLQAFKKRCIKKLVSRCSKLAVDKAAVTFFFSLLIIILEKSIGIAKKYIHLANVL